MTTPSRSVILPLSKKLIANSNVLCHFAALKPENIAMTMRNFIPMGITAMIENFIGNVNLTTEGPHLLQVIIIRAEPNAFGKVLFLLTLSWN